MGETPRAVQRWGKQRITPGLYLLCNAIYASGPVLGVRAHSASAEVTVEESSEEDDEGDSERVEQMVPGALLGALAGPLG